MIPCSVHLSFWKAPGLGMLWTWEIIQKGKVSRSGKVDTEYDRAKVPPYNGNHPRPPSPGSLKALLFPPLLNNVQNKGTQGVQARYGAELPPFISIVRCPGLPVMLGMENCPKKKVSKSV